MPGGFLLPQETHKGHQVNSLSFGSTHSSSAPRDTEMIKIRFLLSVEGDTNEQLERNVTSTLEEHCTLCLGCADRGVM